MPNVNTQKNRLIVWKDYETNIRHSVKLYKNSGFRSWLHKGIREIFISEDQNKMDYQTSYIRGVEFDEVLFINCDQSFLPMEVKPQLYRARFIHVNL